jgi:hypothetical protein
MIAQLSLNFRQRVATRQRKNGAARVQDVIAKLRDIGTWATSRELCESLDMKEREIRAAANAIHGEILSYPGSPGYVLTALATDDEYFHGLNAITAQAQEMSRRSNEIRKARFEQI